MHWAQKYIGKPWVSGARGPDAFDCWGLLWHVKREHFRQELPQYPGVNARDFLTVCRMIDAGAHATEWKRLEQPAEGCAVGMSQRGNGRFHHVGIWTDADGGLVVHAMDKANVVAQPVEKLKLQGFGRIEFFEYYGARC